MIEQEPPRTRLEQLLRKQHLTLEEFRKRYQRAANGTELSDGNSRDHTTGMLTPAGSRRRLSRIENPRLVYSNDGSVFFRALTVGLRLPLT